MDQSSPESRTVFDLAKDPEVVGGIESLSPEDYLKEEAEALDILRHGRAAQLTAERQVILLGYLETLARKLGCGLFLLEGPDA